MRLLIDILVDSDNVQSVCVYFQSVFVAQHNFKRRERISSIFGFLIAFSRTKKVLADLIVAKTHCQG